MTREKIGLLQDYRADLQNIRQPATILVGSLDELFSADQYAPIMTETNPRIAVRIIPEVSHIGMTVDKPALEAIAREVTNNEVER